MREFLEDIGDLVFGNKRLSIYQHFAQSKGFSYKRKVVPELLPAPVQSFSVFNRKKSQSIKGFVYKKEVGLNVLGQVFDYHLNGDFGKKSTTIYLFESKALDLPVFKITPRGHFSRLGNLFRSNKWVNVDKSFNERFEVTSQDETVMHMIITEQFAEVLLHLGDYYVEGNADFLAIYRPNEVTDIIDMDNVYQAGLELVDIILHDHGNELI